LDVSIHHLIDQSPIRATLFLHEDLLARTLAFELDLQHWRLAEIAAGRGDPVRPQYEEVFEVFGTTKHRWHSLKSVLRSEEVYSSTDCPGVYALSAKPFPEIETVLSIPFSVLHNFPRLASIAPLNNYQCDLLKMASDIVTLWSWDPSSDQIQVRQAFISASQIRTAQPPPIVFLA
jgi:hypothetical protein